MKIIIFVLLISFSGLFAQAGTEGHGGDEVGIQFQQAFRAGMLEILKRPDFIPLANLKSLAALEGTAKILVIDCPANKKCPVNFFVSINGVPQESIAINDPDNQIIFINRTRWNQVRNVHVLEAIALHEMLSLLKLEDTGKYEISGRYLSIYGWNSESILHPFALSDEEFKEQEKARLEALEVKNEVLKIRKALVESNCDEEGATGLFTRVCDLSDYPENRSAIGVVSKDGSSWHRTGSDNDLLEQLASELSRGYRDLGYGHLDANGLYWRFRAWAEGRKQKSRTSIFWELTPLELAPLIVAQKHGR